MAHKVDSDEFWFRIYRHSDKVRLKREGSSVSKCWGSIGGGSIKMSIMEYVEELYKISGYQNKVYSQFCELYKRCIINFRKITMLRKEAMFYICNFED